VSDPRSHFDALYRLHRRLGPPLRPNGEVIAEYRRLVTGHGARVLLLGMTPGLADIGEEVEAVDKNPEAIARIWPGDTERRRAHRADWLALPFPARRFTAAVGDGALNSVGHLRDYSALFAELDRVLAPGAPFVTRVYATPSPCETMAAVAEAGSPDIEVGRIKIAFDRLFPDRAALAAAAQWEIEDVDTIDAYSGSSAVYSFPTLAEVRATVPASFGEMQLVHTGTYPLAERCPLLLLRKGGRR
jgi:SAM-dependent methyltransferase